MRRPFALVGFTYLLAQVAAVFLGTAWLCRWLVCCCFSWGSHCFFRACA